jgi:hypothetical protein
MGLIGRPADELRADLASNKVGPLFCSKTPEQQRELSAHPTVNDYRNKGSNGKNPNRSRPARLAGSIHHARAERY